MKLIRKRKPSMKTLLGVTNAKRKFAKATGIPTTKSVTLNRNNQVSYRAKYQNGHL